MNENNLLPTNNLINCAGQLIDLSEPRVMAILNITPDSFYDGGALQSLDAIVQRAGEQLEAGATFLDVGGASTRPRAQEVSEKEELSRVIPAVEAIRKAFPEALISIDTWRAAVVRQTADLDIAMVNDISGGQFDKKMWATVGELGLPYVFMHTKGKPKHMQENPEYQNVSLDICDYFSERIPKLRALGINDILIDPGFGFGKTVRHNYQLLNDLAGFRILGCPVLVGISRKSMVYKPLETDARHALHGTTAAHMLALQNGASILRVHDVAPAVDCIKIYSCYQEAAKEKA